MKYAPMSGKTVMKVLENQGWFLNNSNGRHRVFVRFDRDGHVTVPDHKELQVGTLRSIIKQSGMTLEEFYVIANQV